VKSPQPLTIRDIAREAGVSTATVSRVINTPDLVSPNTRASVESAIERNGYLSHGIAVSLASARSHSIGLVIPTITNSIYASFTQAIQGITQSAGYTLLLGNSEFSPELEEKLIRKFIERRVDGMILIGGERRRGVYDLVESHRVPFVVTWKSLRERVGRPSISFDNYRGGCLAVQHLIKLGHRRIGLICGRTVVNDRARERRSAYEDTMRENGLVVEDTLIEEAEFELIQGGNAMRRLLNLKESPTAVFCANDIQAIGALFECGEKGLSVPGDISLVGFDDLPIAQYIRPQLTTIRVPAQKMGELAAESILYAIKTGRVPETEELPVELIVRNSTAPPSNSLPVRNRLGAKN
jgi:LacI family transcriptional regulator